MSRIGNVARMPSQKLAIQKCANGHDGNGESCRHPDLNPLPKRAKRASLKKAKGLSGFGAFLSLGNLT